ncbi:hypothetical protein HMPREF0290_0866 [Corynebacterium efficiens YS-314]|uniref:Gp28/Gp37-like domain-containing protein n=1 Tax=Corynebacterium efficiens (strain DSM 44549 / YS-314 / AJ 12310 / JCM 11189 / NBRC 100395) TaxID=196164 RepID=Q8FRA5_COREF|nr:hypothetical protein [Corynebacterium efficiens]EEW50418.1 hypothetical protein HMPREF0290_0866 [Corynebacterium efficiens YS-314]BAC17666.1 hypothetical protein [Corynebacterium efficiens YS-314]
MWSEADWQKWQSDIGLSALAFGRAIWLIDRDGVPYSEVRGWITHDFGESALDVATGSVTIFADNEVVTWLLARRDQGLIGGDAPDMDAVLHEAVHMVVQEPDGTQWGYRVHELSIEIGGSHGGTVEIIGLRPLEHWKHMVLKSNPNSPNEFQLLWSDIRQGQSMKIIKEYIHRNLEREMQPLVLLGQWDVSQPSAWSGVDTSRWPVIMNPRIPPEATEWAVIEARYDNAWDALHATATAAGLILKAEYWFPGQPQPAPDFWTLTQPTIVLDVVDRSIHRGATGDIREPLRTLKRMFLSPGEGELADLVQFDPGAAATESGLQPWVVWKPTEYQAISRFVISKSTDSKFTIGGQSPAALNTVLGTGIRALAAGIGSLFPGIGPALAVIVGDIGSEMIKDRILAFQSFDHHRRRAHHGRLRYREISKPGEAYSISAVQQGVAAMEETGGGISFEIAVVDDAPYKLDRDYAVGDQVGVEVLGIILASYVSEAHRIGARGELGVTVGIGDPRARESPTAMLNRNLDNISGILGRLKSYVGATS